MIALTLLAAYAMEPLQEGWPKPIHDGRPWGMLTVDQLEYRAPAFPGVVATDAEGWWGPDFDRLRYRLEGEFEVETLDGDGEAALLYSRLVSPWLELQAGVGAEGTTEPGGEVRLEAGIEYVVPYDIDIEAHVRLSHRARVSARVTAIKEFRLTQRLITQLRAEVEGAAQDSKALDTAWGLQNASGAIRLRYEVKREFAPYAGFRWETSAASLAGGRGFEHQPMAVAGVRVWY